jgi:hypothetical protein
VALWQFRQQIALWQSPPDHVIRHYHMDGVIGSPPRHVTTRALVRSRMRSGKCSVALPAGINRVARPVRVVARQAGHLPIALQETLRFSQPVSAAARDLEFILVTGPRSVIEGESKIAQRFAGQEGKRPSFEAPDHARQPRTRGLEVTLHAQIELPLFA